MNTFGYVGGNPLGYVDPEGKIAIPAPWIIPPIIDGIIGGLAGIGLYDWLFKRPPADSCEDDDDCDQIREKEEENCFKNYGMWGYGNWVFRGCMDRAGKRWGLCKANNGSMPPDAPDPWSDEDVDGAPTIHD